MKSVECVVELRSVVNVQLQVYIAVSKVRVHRLGHSIHCLVKNVVYSVHCVVLSEHCHL